MIYKTQFETKILWISFPPNEKKANGIIKIYQHYEIILKARFSISECCNICSIRSTQSIQLYSYVFMKLLLIDAISIVDRNLLILSMNFVFDHCPWMLLYQLNLGRIWSKRKKPVLVNEFVTIFFQFGDDISATCMSRQEFKLWLQLVEDHIQRYWCCSIDYFLHYIIRILIQCEFAEFPANLKEEKNGMNYVVYKMR